MRLSICIPTYNRAEMLRSTLDNIIDQTPADCEIVISDNGSTDATAEVVADFRKKFDRITYIRSDTNLGADMNALRAVEAAQGDYCWFLADDDHIVKDGVSYVLSKYLNGGQPVDLLILSYQIYDSSMKCVVGSSLDFTKLTDDLYTNNYVKFFEFSFSELCMSAYVIRRELWLKTNPIKYEKTGIIILGGAYEYLNETRHALFSAKPLFKYRSSHLSWTDLQLEVLLERVPRGMEILPSKYNSVKTEALRGYYDRYPVTLKMLLSLRAEDSFSIIHYRKYITKYWSGSPFKKCAAKAIALTPVVMISSMQSLYKMFFKSSRVSK